jgi:hypothetical protein
MIKYIKENSHNIDMKTIVLFSCLRFSYYVDTNVGTHYGVSFGNSKKQLHILFRNWNNTELGATLYDA